MKYQNLVAFLIITFALFYTLSLLGNAQAQTTSSANQTILVEEDGIILY